MKLVVPDFSFRSTWTKMKSGLIFSLLLSPLLAKHVLVETEDQVDKKKYKEKKGDDFHVCIDIYLWLHFIYIMIHEAECLSVRPK